jgi:hypothetical protein
MSVDVQTEIVIGRPVDVVATYAADPSNAPAWYANIDSVEWKTPPPATVGTRVAFVARFLGRKLEYTYEFVDFVPGERQVMRTAQGPFPMETTYTLAEASAASTRDRLLVGHSARPVGVGWAPRTGRQINLRTTRQHQAPARAFESDPTPAPTTDILVARSGARRAAVLTSFPRRRSRTHAPFASAQPRFGSGCTGADRAMDGVRGKVVRPAGREPVSDGVWPSNRR